MFLCNQQNERKLKSQLILKQFINIFHKSYQQPMHSLLHPDPDPDLERPDLSPHRPHQDKISIILR